MNKPSKALTVNEIVKAIQDGTPLFLHLNGKSGEYAHDKEGIDLYLTQVIDFIARGAEFKLDR